jgi:Sporulation and spore germination
VIPRNLAVSVAILCSLTFGMSLYLWELRHREAMNTPREPLPQHVAAPATGQTESITLMIAHDDGGELHPESLALPVSNNQQERVQEILRQLLTVYQAKGSPHPLTSNAEVRNVYLTQSGIAVVDVNGAFADGQTSGVLAEELTLVSFTQTLALNAPNISAVKFLVDGKERETLAGHADISSTFSTADASQLAHQLTAK